MKLRLVFVCMAFMGFLVTPAFSMSTEEASLGRYVYQSKTLNISLRIDVDGVKELVINDKKFSRVFPAAYSVAVSSVGVYVITIRDDKDSSVHEIKLIDLFDDKGEVIAVAGFYLQRKIESYSRESTDNSVVLVFQPKFTRIPIG